MKRIRRGQSTLEYVIILAGVIGAIIMVAAMFKPKLQSTYDTLGTSMCTTMSNVSL
jgi:hypothetical protein